MNHRSQYARRWLVRARRFLVPIVLTLLLVVGFTSALFMAGVAIALFIVGLTTLPLSVWIGPVLLLFSLSGMMLAACMFLLVPGTGSERWVRLARILLLVSLGCDLASIIVPQLLSALR